jgi:hypothetical protein
MVMLLDYIPRYGRLYTFIRFDENENMVTEKHWKWQKCGRWGLNLLNDMGLLWRYIDHCVENDDGTLE